MKKTTTHFAVVKDGAVIGSRSSDSFGPGGKCYAFASCWHRVGGSWIVATWHTTAALASKSRPVSLGADMFDGHQVLPVLIVSRRLEIGTREGWDLELPTAGQNLRTIAEQLDARYTETIKSRTDGKRDRWTLTADDERIPEIRVALAAKVVADDAWISWQRANSPKAEA